MDFFLSDVVNFHPDAFCARAHGRVFLAEADVDGLDGGEILKKATGNALTDVLQELGPLPVPARGREVAMDTLTTKMYGRLIAWEQKKPLTVRDGSVCLGDSLIRNYREAGGLDGRFFAHMEEIDLCWRLRSRGRVIVCIPQGMVYHVGAATLRKENPRKTFLNIRNNLLMLYKNLPEGELKSVLFIRGALDWLAAFVFLLKGDGKNAKAVIQARKEFKRIRADFEASRVENMAKAIGRAIPEKVNYSILWKYHVERRRVFFSLKS